MSQVKSVIFLALSFSTCFHACGGMVKPNVIEAFGDFNGDLIIDRARGFPEANSGKGRVDIHWGQSSYIPTSPTVISQVMYPASTLRSGSLGAALAAGDFNGDGADDLAIGAPDSADVGHFSGGGSVHVIFGCSTCNSLDANGGGLPANLSPLNPLASSTWHQSQPSPSFNDRPRFGFALASGDFNNDGFDDLAMAQPFDTFSGKSEAGRVMVRYGSRTGLQLVISHFHQGNIKGSYSLDDQDHFGWDLASANLDGRNGDELIVGTPGEDWGNLTDPGEATVFWSGAKKTALSARSNTRIRMSTDWVGSTRANQRFGEELIARSNPTGGDGSWRGVIEGGLATSSSCDMAAIELRVDKNRVITQPSPGFNCGADFCEIVNDTSHGQLPAVAVHFTEIVQTVATGGTVAKATASSLPGGWVGTHPITGNSLSGPLNYYFAMIDLINQQMVTHNGGPICDGNDCLKFVYGGRSSLSDISALCPELADLSDPSLELTENCNGNCAPRPLSPRKNAADLSTYAHEAVMACINRGGLPNDALNIIIYDNCRAVNGLVACSGGGGNRNGRARSGLNKNSGDRQHSGAHGPNHPGIYIDWERAVQPRVAGDEDVSAAEEHEIGHAFGLHHRVMCSTNPQSPTMYSSDVISNKGVNESGTRNVPAGCASDPIREQGFSNYPGFDFYDRNIVEVKKLVEAARKHHKELWTCPSH